MSSSRHLILTSAMLMMVLATIIWQFFSGRLPNGYRFVKDRSNCYIIGKDNLVECGSRSSPEGSIRSYYTDGHLILGVTEKDVFFVVDTRVGRVVAVRLDGSIVRTSDK